MVDLVVIVLMKAEGTGCEDSLACAGGVFPEWQEMGNGRDCGRLLGV